MGENFVVGISLLDKNKKTLSYIIENLYKYDIYEGYRKGYGKLFKLCKISIGETKLSIFDKQHTLISKQKYRKKWKTLTTEGSDSLCTLQHY